MRLSGAPVRALIALCAATASSLAVAAVPFTGAPYMETFDSLPTSGTANAWTNDATLAGWSLFRQPAPGTPIPSIAANTGNSSTGAIVSFGLDSDRAFGGVGSGNATYFGGPATGAIAAWIAVALKNTSGATINDLNVAFDGEQWRNGGNASAQTTVLEYGLGATFDAVAAWTAPGGTFDFVSPITGASAATLNGNEDANRVANLGGALATLGWANDDTLWIRWVERNDTGNDHGLGIDNLKITTGTVTPPPTNNSDFNNDLIVDGQDFLKWQEGFGLTGVPLNDKSTGDANGDGSVNDGDLAAWQVHFGLAPATSAAVAAPEPTGLCMLAIAALALGARRSCRATTIDATI